MQPNKSIFKKKKRGGGCLSDLFKGQAIMGESVAPGRAGQSVTMSAEVESKWAEGSGREDEEVRLRSN